MRVPPAWCPPGAPDPSGVRRASFAPVARPISSIFCWMNAVRASSFGRYGPPSQPDFEEKFSTIRRNILEMEEEAEVNRPN
jgi:hypothetical protein